MKYLIAFLLAVVLALVARYFDSTLLTLLPLAGIAVVVALVSLAFFAQVSTFLVPALLALALAWVGNSIMGWSWASYVVAVALGVLCASIAVRLAPKGTGTAKSA